MLVVMESSTSDPASPTDGAQTPVPQAHVSRAHQTQAKPSPATQALILKSHHYHCAWSVCLAAVLNSHQYYCAWSVYVCMPVIVDLRCAWSVWIRCSYLCPHHSCYCAWSEYGCYREVSLLLLCVECCAVSAYMPELTCTVRGVLCCAVCVLACTITNNTVRGVLCCAARVLACTITNNTVRGVCACLPGIPAIISCCCRFYVMLLYISKSGTVCGVGH